MKQYLTPFEIANEIRMLRSLHLGAFVIVEGTTDASLYAICIDSKQCAIHIAHNKTNAIKALSLLVAEGFRGVIAVVDADYDRVLGRVPVVENLMLTDTHDAETMLCSSPAFEKVLAEYGPATS